MSPRRDIEGPIHRAVLDYLRLALPQARIHHSPNETDMSGPQAIRMVAKAKRMGTRPGWPDLEILPGNGRVYFMEVKAPKGRLSDHQADLMNWMIAVGYEVAVVRSVDDAKAAVRAWGLA